MPEAHRLPARVRVPLTVRRPEPGQFDSYIGFCYTEMVAEGTVYMLCFAERIGDTSNPRWTAKHYVGIYYNPSRIEHHRNGTSGVPLVAAFFKAGIPFVVSRKMRGTKADERRIKRSGQHARNCPNCTPRPRNGAWRNETN